jgi:serralysin
VANGDVIADFDHAADNFRLENAVMKALGSVGALKVGFFFAGVHAHDVDDHIIYNKANGALYYDDDGIGAHAAIQLAYLTNKPVLAADDFAVI